MYAAEHRQKWTAQHTKEDTHVKLVQYINPTTIRMAIMLAMLLSLATGVTVFAEEEWGGV